MDSKRELNWFYVAAFCILASYFMGYLSRSRPGHEVSEIRVVEERVKIQVVKEEVVKERVVVQWKDRVVTKVRTEKKPDGTEITESSITSTTLGSSTNSQEYTRKELVASERYRLTDVTREEAKVKELPRYTVTVLMNPLKFNFLLPTIQVGIRLGDLPVYLTGGYVFSSNEAQLGLTLEF